MRRRRSGQASLISLALYSALIIAGVSTIVVLGRPILEDMQDAAAVDTATDILSDLGDQVQTVADGGKGSQVTAGLRFSRGRVIVSAEDDSITYELMTDARIISPHTTQEIGSLRLSALAGVDVRESSVNGQDCWLMENDHVEVCIRSVPDTPAGAIGGSTVGFWRFNDAGGNTAVDNATYGNDGTVTGATWVDGIRRSALEFDGDDTVTVADDEVLDPGETVTVAAWVNASGSGTGKVVRKGGAYGLWANTTTAVFELDGQNVSGSIGNGWTHVAGRYNATHQILAVEGVQKAAITRTGTVPATGDDLVIGDGFTGQLDEVRVWNRSLTPEAVDWQAETNGLLTYVDTDDLLLSYRNSDAGKNLSANMSISLHTGQGMTFTNNGTGSVQPTVIGRNLGIGEVVATVHSFYGIDYEVVFQLASDSDFVKIDVRET